MSLRQMFSSTSFAGVLSAGVACFFIGLTMVLWVIWDWGGFSMDHFSYTARVSVLVWLIGWMFFHHSWKKVSVQRKKVHRTAVILAATGLATTLFAFIKLFFFP